MRLLITAVLFGVSLIVVSPLDMSSAMATEPSLFSLPEASPASCQTDRTAKPLEPEVAAACFEASLPPPSWKHPEDRESSALAADEAASFAQDPTSFGPEPAAALAPRQAVAGASIATGTTAVGATATPPSYQVEDNHDVRRFLDHFQTGYRRAIVERWLVRAGRYLPMVLNVFKQKGLPEELVFTAMIESGFNPLAVSRAGAKGLWQFMAPTARRYGLRVDRWMDERLDPEKSTVAAARHFIDLYAVFGSWNLAQAAYNAGERTVLDAIHAMGTSDFWALARGRWLADETKNFIPAIKAATLIAREPERYGFMVTPAAPLMYDVISVPGSTSLRRLASASGLGLDALERLNPELRLKQTPPGGAYSLKVPVGGAALVRSALDRAAAVRALAAARSGGRGRQAHLATPYPTRPTIHVVRRQETASLIAQRYNVSVDDLIRWNGLDSTALIRVGDRLRVAGAERPEETQGRPK
jgi:membrane-bound lytic murein transglycosylase D